VLNVAQNQQVAQNGSACRDFRLKAKLSVDEAARAIDVTAPHLRNIENEHRSASDLHLERLADLYAIRVNSLRRVPVSQRMPVSV
jgi:transcriptional regulator with XRE-family HTH domain